MNSAIIVAAGKGTRMGEGVPKQFRLLACVPLVVHTLRRFEEAASVSETIVVVGEAERAEFLSLISKYCFSKLKHVVAGGASRSESVWRGLGKVRRATAEIVAVHDGARPFVGSDEIDKVIAAAHETGAAILARAATDTIKICEDGIIKGTPARETVFHALTPQAFRYEILFKAYSQAIANNDLNATDDSALVEQAGGRVQVIEGSARNIKITHAEDWELAERFVRGRGTGDGGR